MKHLKLLTMITSLGVIFVSCKKQENESAIKPISTSVRTSTNETSIVPPPNYATIHAYRTEARKFVAQALAKAMLNSSVRSFLKTQVNLQLQNETEFLYAQHYNTVIYNGKTFATILRENSVKNDTFFTLDLLYYDPYLTILIPDDYEPENWNLDILIPQVAAAPSGWEDDSEIFAPVYDDLGQITLVSSDDQPLSLTVVVAECESLTAFSLPYTGNPNNPYFVNDFYKYYDNENATIDDGEEFVVNNDKSTSAYTNDRSVRRACDRDNNTTKLDKMGSLNINGKSSLKTMESWLKGGVELVYRIVYNSGTPTNRVMVDYEKIIRKITRKEAKNSTSIAVNITHMVWGSALVMDRYFIMFAEREGNGGAPDPRNSTLTLAIDNVTISLTQSINWRRRDRQCGQQEVGFCNTANGNGTTYNTGLVTFNIKI